MAVAELGCSYASLILHDDGIPITAEKISALLEASNINVESFWPKLFAKLAEKRSLGDLLSSAGAVCCVNTVSFAPAAAAVVEKKEEKKEESGDDDMGYDDGLYGSTLFD